MYVTGFPTPIDPKPPYIFLELDLYMAILSVPCILLCKTKVISAPSSMHYYLNSLARLSTFPTYTKKNRSSET